jgi:hypothetical protein
MVLSTEIYSLQQELTHSALLDFFCSDGNNVEHLNHYYCNCVHHSLIWRRFSVCVQTSEKCFYALEHLKESVLVRANVLRCLKSVRITMDPHEGIKKSTH